MGSAALPIKELRHSSDLDCNTAIHISITYILSNSIMSLTPDLVEWLLADKKVCQKWKNLARRLELGDHIPHIERRHGSDSRQLRMIIKLWQELSPETFTIRCCKNILAAEGLHHMLLWLNLMTQNSTATTQNSTARTEPRIQQSSPWSGYLYNQPLHRTSRAHSYTSDYYSNTTTPEPSRPSSRQSDQDYSQYSRPSSQQSDNFYYKTTPSQTNSCPSTPQNYRRNIDIFPSCITKPGAIPPASSYQPKTTTPSNTIYSLLYKPDLIKLSSPRIVRRATRRSDILNKKNNTTVLKRQHTSSLSELESFQTDDTSNRIKSDIEDRTDHEKEILKLCDEILVEINGKDLDTKNICMKNDNETNKQSRDLENRSVVKNNDSVKVNVFNVHKVKTVQLVSINKELIKQDETAENINETYTTDNNLTKIIGYNNTAGNNGDADENNSHNFQNSDYFDHLV